MASSRLLAALALLLCTACAAASPRGITVAIKHRNMHRLQAHLELASNPTSPLYGRHLSLAELSEMVGPSEGTVRDVSRWLQRDWCAQDLEFSHGREWVTATAMCLPSYAPAFSASVPVPESMRSLVDIVTLSPLSSGQSHTPERPSVQSAGRPPRLFPQRALALAHSPADGEVELRVFLHMHASERAAIGPATMHVALEEVARPLAAPSELSAPAQCRALGDFVSHAALPRLVSHFVASAHPSDVLCSAVLPPAAIPRHLSDALVHVRARLCGIAPPTAARPAPCREWALAGATAAAGGEAQRLPALLAATSYPPNAQKQVYDMPLDLAGSNKTNAQLVWGTGTYGYSPNDLSTFYKDFDVDNSISLTSAIGMEGKAGGANWVEATLDIQYVSGMGTGVRSFVVNSDNSSAAEAGGEFGPAFVRFSRELANNPSPPYTISISLGSLSWASCNKLCEEAVAMGASPSMQECTKYTRGLFQVCMYDDDLQVKRIDEELMKLGSRGVTVFAAAGDGGNHFSFGAFNPLNPLGRALNEISCNYTLPTYPASSPWVVAVGGTQMKDGAPIGCSSQTGGGITGGCGFSWTFDQPTWQSPQVTSYLGAINQTAAGAPNFNAAGRAYPDVSAIASGVPIVESGRKESVGGTSASTPEVAGMFSIINDQRLNSGLPPLGFFNPRLYQATASNPALFVDVTSGSSSCGTDKCCSTGFDAIPGFDVFTGFGQPLFSAWLKEFGSD